MGKKSRLKWINREKKAENKVNRKKKIKKWAKISFLIILIGAVLGTSGYFGWKKYSAKKAISQAAAATTQSTDDKTANEVKDNEVAVVDTNQGTIKIQLYRSVAPKTVENFVKLATQGFYDSTKFHRVIKDFMIQGGDPLSKDDTKKDSWGKGDPGYKFDDEPVTLDYKRGIVAMANSGPNTNGSQFFIMQKDNLTLPKSYTIFGNVIEGMDVVDKIATTATDSNDRPLANMTINKITIETTSSPQAKAETQVNPDNAVQVKAVNQNGQNIDVTGIKTEPVK